MLSPSKHAPPPRVAVLELSDTFIEFLIVTPAYSIFDACCGLRTNRSEIVVEHPVHGVPKLPLYERLI